MGKLVIFGENIVVRAKYGRCEIRQLFPVGRKLSERFGLTKLTPRVAYTQTFCLFKTTLPLPGDALGCNIVRACADIAATLLTYADTTPCSR